MESSHTHRASFYSQQTITRNENALDNRDSQIMDEFPKTFGFGNSRSSLSLR